MTHLHLLPHPPRLPRRCGLGFGAPRPRRLAPRRRPALGRPGHRPAQPARPAAAAVSRQGETHHPHLRQRRAVARRYLRPQAGAAEVRRQDAAPAQPRHRTQDRGRLPVAVQVPAVRRERHRGQRAVPARRRAHRRHRRHPLDARRRAQPRAVAAADELRRGPAHPPVDGLLADLRPGHREPEPARLHRHVPRRLPDPGVAELAGRLPARRLPGHLHRHPAHRTSKS